MAGIQNAALPIVSSLMLGDWSALQPEHAPIIANWAAMTAMNIDASTPLETVTLPEERHSLKISMRAPPTWLIFVGMPSGPAMEAHQRNIVLERWDKNLQKLPDQRLGFITYQAGSALFHVLIWRPGAAHIDAADYGRSVGLLPVSPVWADIDCDLGMAQILFRKQVELIWDGLADRLRLALGQFPLRTGLVRQI